MLLKKISSKIFKEDFREIRRTDDIFCRGFFYVFGDIKSIIVSHKTKCAFINFTTRTSAELAASKVAEVGLNLKGHALKVVWARPRPAKK